MNARFPAQDFFDPAIIKPGDVIAFSGEGLVGDIINLGTFGIPRWNICHVGIVGEARMVASYCSSQPLSMIFPVKSPGAKFDGTQAHNLDTVCKGYRGKVWHYALCRPLYDFERKRLTEFLMGRSIFRTARWMPSAPPASGLSWVKTPIPRPTCVKSFAVNGSQRPMPTWDSGRPTTLAAGTRTA